jgi:hypothetical protein
LRNEDIIGRNSEDCSGDFISIPGKVHSRYKHRRLLGLTCESEMEMTVCLFQR